MTGKTYRFFAMIMSKDAEPWSLEDLFKGLFDVCFPVDIRIKVRVRDTLLNQKQGHSTVQECVCELKELFSLAGSLLDVEKVTKLWYSLYEYIQKEI
jgi:hypothetical protein